MPSLPILTTREKLRLCLCPLSSLHFLINRYSTPRSPYSWEAPQRKSDSSSTSMFSFSLVRLRKQYPTSASPSDLLKLVCWDFYQVAAFPTFNALAKLYVMPIAGSYLISLTYIWPKHPEKRPSPKQWKDKHFRLSYTRVSVAYTPVTCLR